ncbi:hypothetical protein HHI36_005938 [Cryptolaemus montrouzieri]|uniref:Right handed beta helix domain-containing protein n=1 Tax=Cryptolaemus montrouzieri TaxID=559131 RepID=A0ABD2NVI9_9CUCU
MDQVYCFDKTLLQRLEEYTDVLSGFEVLPASALSKEWGFYLELTIDPNGWQAVWKISRATCESLKIPFPTLVLVLVLNIDFPSLQALVRVIAVQDDIQIPEKHYVPLIQLWPTKLQDRSVALNMATTAKVIDMLRFFFTHLFMPWDIEDDESDWKTKHLESRLRLYYDMKNGVIPKVTSERLNSLLTEARRLQHKKEILEEEFDDSVIDDISNHSHVDYLTDLHLRLLEIKSEVEILENPLLRKAVIRRQLQHISVNNDPKEPKIWLIHENSLLENYITFLEQVKMLYPNDIVTVQPNLSLALENSSQNDSFVLSNGRYDMNIVGALEMGGTLKGIGSNDKTILVSTLEDILFDFQADQALVENVTIDASRSQCAAVIRRGKVTFSNCKIFGDGQSSTHQGIIVLAGSELELKNCEIYGLCTAVVGNSGSKIYLRNTEIHDVHFGLKIYDNSFVNAQKCVFRDCKDYGICVETENNLKGGLHSVGNFDALNIMPEVKTELVSGINNGKGDVVINRTSQVKAIEDLFCSNRDPTVSADLSEEDMLTEDETGGWTVNNEMNKTVVENLQNISPATV